MDGTLADGASQGRGQGGPAGGRRAAQSMSAPAVHSAQADDGWIGKRVVQKYGSFRLKIENRLIDPKEFVIYRVEQVNGPWLWLTAEGQGLSGWAPADQVVAVDDAIAFFTDYIRANPGETGLHDESDRLAPGDARTRQRPWRLQRSDSARPDESLSATATEAFWYDKKDYEKAIADYSEAIRLDPTYVLAFNNRGAPGHDKTDYDKAIADFSEAIRLDPKDAVAYDNRGIAWYDKKDYDRAIADYNEAIRLDPKYVRDSSTAVTPGLEERIRQGDRRLQRGDPARSEVRRRVLQPRPRLVRQEGIRQGDRRLQRGDPARSEVCPWRSTTAATPGP